MRRIRFLNPRSDQGFLHHVEEVMRQGIRTPQELQTRLRAVYPMAVVRERGLSGDLEPIWYVYRDGRWVPDRPREEEG